MKLRSFRQARRGSKRPVAVIRVCFSVVCIVLLAVWSVSPSTQAWGADTAPLVVRTDFRRTPKDSEATLLAHRTLARESKKLLIAEKRRSELAREIKGVLKRLRYAHPEMAKVSARAAHLPGVLILGVKPDLFRDVSRFLGQMSHMKKPVKLRTGNPAFDALNAKLGLRTVRRYRHTGVIVMHLSERLNVRAARRAYKAIEGVRDAIPDAYLGDGSDIEAAKSSDTWHIVVRKAWGDCPSGCLYNKMFFFTVKDGNVERIEPVRAMTSPEFRKILETRNWR